MIYLELFYVFFTTGLFTFGGGYAMLPMIQQAVVDRGWMPLEKILDFVAVSESTPGPFAVNLGTYIGSEKGGIPGAAVAVAAVVLPSLVIISIISGFYKKFKDNKINHTLNQNNPTVEDKVDPILHQEGPNIVMN